MNKFIKSILDFIPRVMKRTAVTCIIIDANNSPLSNAHCKRLKRKIRLCERTLLFKMYKKYIKQFIDPPTTKITVNESNEWVNSIPQEIKYKPTCLMKRDVLKVLDELDLLVKLES